MAVDVRRSASELLESSGERVLKYGGRQENSPLRKMQWPRGANGVSAAAAAASNVNTVLRNPRKMRARNCRRGGAGGGGGPCVREVLSDGATWGLAEECGSLLLLPFFCGRG